MSCFGNCCNANCICEFDGDMRNVVSAPIYVQQIFDAVRFNLQGMKTYSEQEFCPAIPPGYRIKRVVDIRCKKYFNPANVDDPDNLNLDVNTSISGASFLTDAKGNYLHVIGADGTFSERIMYADTSDCDDQCKGTPVFGTQTVGISGNITIELDLLLCDPCNNETLFTVCTTVNVATSQQPMVLTNFFEICMPSSIDTAFLPRFTEFCNSACEARLATNNCGRDLIVDCNGVVSGNLIVAICLTCEKKIVVPVQLCVLSTGYMEAPLQRNSVCTTFPSLFPQSIGNCSHSNACNNEDGGQINESDCDQCPPQYEESHHKPPMRPQPRR